MPYIDRNKRPNIDAGAIPKTNGEVVYKYYRQMVRQFKARPSFDTIFNIWNQRTTNANILFVPLAPDGSNVSTIAHWELAFFEFYHRFARPYEDQKKEENGDVE